jgi:hypothetical protein
MRFFCWCLLSVVVFSSSLAFAADCVSFAEARHYIGKTQCVSGTVFHVKQGSNGVTFLDFCEDYEVCSFTAIVFEGDLSKLGDVRQLKGRSVELQGRIEEYDGRAEIVLKKPQQLGEAASLLTPFTRDAALTPTLPRDYDVENRGHYSAGKFKRPKKVKTSRKKEQGAPISTTDATQ